MTFETGTDAPAGVHEFEVRDIAIRTSALSDARFYGLLLGTWAVIIAVYVGWRLSGLRRYARERRLLQDLALKEAQEAARRDPLTHLLNRRGLTERYGEMAAQRRGQRCVAVILLDVDHFKRLNDTHGHDAGDTALGGLAERLGRHVRSVDLVARWGGEEFIIVCADIDRKGAMRVAQKLKAEIAGHDFGACGQLTASFGIAWAAEMAEDLSPLVAQADVALYEAKASGRNCCRFYKGAVLKAA